MLLKQLNIMGIFRKKKETSEWDDMEDLEIVDLDSDEEFPIEDILPQMVPDIEQPKYSPDLYEYEEELEEIDQADSEIELEETDYADDTDDVSFIRKPKKGILNFIRGLGKSEYDDEDLEDENAEDEDPEDENIDDEDSDQEDSKQYVSEDEEADFYDEDIPIVAATTHKKKTSGNKKLQDILRRFTVFDIAIAATGLILLIVVGTIVALSMVNTGYSKQVAAITQVGVKMNELSTVGESELLAMADAQESKMAESEQAAQLAQSNLDKANAAALAKEAEMLAAEQAAKNAIVTVKLSFTSVEKDLKIKIINQSTKKLISGQAFECTVTDPDGKESTWVDDNKDGVIYKSDLEPGKYTVLLKEMTGYIVPTDKAKTTVKDKIVYQQVEVADEVKTEAEISDAVIKVEDTEEKQTVAPTLTDTVGWVASATTTRTADQYSYVTVDKSKITDPATAVARVYTQYAQVFTISSVGITPASANVDINGTKSLAANVVYTGTPVDVNANPQIVTWTSSDSSIASVDSTGTVTGKAAGTVTITATSITDDVPGTKTGTASITVNPAPIAATVSLMDTATVSKGLTVTLTATLTGSATAVNWSSSDTTIATVNASGVVTGVKAGTAVITAASSTDATVKDTCTVTVTEANSVTISDKTTVLKDATVTLTATLTGTITAVTWTSSDTTIATVGATTGIITGVKVGTAVITATATTDSTAVDTCTVTVKTNPQTDTTTILQTSAGKTVYVYNSTTKTYVKATYADYYTATTFYLVDETNLYLYTGWQNLNGKTYYYTANNVKVTGEQVIQGAKYVFGSDGVLASNSAILGIDVSKWNGSINWTSVKNSGVSYVIIRCGYRGSTYGTLLEDPMYRSYINGANAAGLKVGVYFYTQAINQTEAVEEASMVINLIKAYKISYPVFIDTEGSGGRGDTIDAATRTAVCQAFCETIKGAGYTPGVYASKSWFTGKLNAGSLGGYKIWLAQYASQPTYTGAYHIWQYSSAGSIGGISGNVDMDLSYMGY